MEIKRLLLFLCIITILLSSNLESNVSQATFVAKNDIDTTDYELIDSTEIKLKEAKVEMVTKKFAYYNDDIQDTTVAQFIKVVEFFKLDTNDYLFNLYISQICYESGAKQFRENGRIIKSNSNAIGIAQIVPSTAFHYLRNILTEEDKKVFILLGGTDMSFVDKYPRYKLNQSAWNESEKWLSNVNNNLILWGYIMKESLDMGRNINSSFVAYNGGSGYLNSWIKEGKSPSNHPYVVKIIKIAENLATL